jgi:hypothetical protein
MKIKILTGCTEESINDFLNTLTNEQFVSIRYYPKTADHYQTYCSIVYKEK